MDYLVHIGLLFVVVPSSSTVNSRHQYSVIVNFSSQTNANPEIITVSELTNISGSFRIDPGTRPEENIAIKVGRKTGHAYTQLHCVIDFIASSTCQINSYQNVCTCLSENSQNVTFWKTVRRSDAGKWLWWSDCEKLKQYEVIFNITYLAEMKSLHLTKTVTKENEPVEVVCTLKQGNPPSEAQLINSKGDVVKQTKGEILKYSVVHASYNDSGTWTCRISETAENKTATLTVYCDAQIQILSEEQADDDATAITFGLHYCSNESIDCSLTNMSTDNTEPRKCSEFNYSKTGELPHLNMNMIVPQGKWIITVKTANHTESLPFSSNPTTGRTVDPSSDGPTSRTTDTTPNPSTTDTTPKPSIATSLLLGINATVLVAVLAMIWLVVLSRRGAIPRHSYIRRSLSFRLNGARHACQRRGWRLFPRRRRELEMCTRKPSNHRLALPPPPVALSPNDYDLINDDHIVVGADVQGATVRPTPCLPRSDYLHPIPAPEDVFGDFKGRREEETEGATGICKEAAVTLLNCAVRSAYLHPTPSDVDRHETVQKLTEDAQTLDFTGQGARPKTNWRLTRNNRLDSASPNKVLQSLPVTIPKTPIRLPLRGNCLSFPSNYVRSETWTDQTDQVGHKEEDSDQVEAVPLPPKRPPRKNLLNLNPQNENRLTSLPLCPEIEVKRPDGGIQQSPARPPPRLPSRKGRHQTTKQRQEKEVQKEDVGCQDVPSPCTFKISEQSSLSAQELLEVLKRRQKHDANLA